jgi:hypothetical protein
MRIPSRMPSAAFLAALCLSLLPFAAGRAQAPLEIDLAPPDASAFPEILLYVTAVALTEDEAGTFAPQDFVILEDGEQRPLASLEVVQSGLDLSLVVNTTRGLGVRDASGQSRFDRVAEALVAWLSGPQASRFGEDRYALITRDETHLDGAPAAAELAATIDYLDPDLTSADTAIDLLTRALEQQAPISSPGVPRAMLFITPFVNITQSLQLADVIARAAEQSTALYPVLVGPASLAEEPALETWRQLAEQTGGSLTLFDPQTGFASVAQELDRLRTRYRLSYPSAASTRGPHTVQVRLVNESIDALSPVRTFRPDVLPPELAFISPPGAVDIQLPPPGRTTADTPMPSVELPLLITFPDGHPRPIVASELLVDGVLAVSQVQPPFDRLTWSVPADARAGEVILQARVTDGLGLQGETAPVNLQLEAKAPPGLLETRPWLLGLLLALLAVTAAGIGAVSRLTSRPAAPVPARRRPRLRRASLAPAAAEAAEARLDPLEADLDPVLLTGTDVTLGGDASLATQVLFDPSVSAVHARLIRQANGRYLVRDQDSAGGSWVNHEQVPPAGRILEHGDLVHFGRLGYRFLEQVEPPVRQIRVTPLDAGPAPAPGSSLP